MAKKSMEYKGLSPVVMALIGAAIVIAVLVCLMLFDFRMIQLAFYLPGLVLAALLIFAGRGKATARKK